MSNMSQLVFPLTIRTVRRVNESIVLVELRDDQNRPLIPFEAGAHIDLHLPDGLVRQYSLCNSPDEHHRYVLAVRMMPNGRGGSKAVHALRPGQTVRAAAPHNLFPLDESAAHSILIAAGIGVTPMLSMAHRLSAIGASFEFHLRSRDDGPSMVSQLGGGSWQDDMIFSSSGDPRPDFRSVFSEAPSDTRVYVCGPIGFSEEIEVAASTCGLTVRKESFVAAGPAGSDRPFRVQTASDAAWHDVPAERTILDVLQDAGYAVPTSCEQGICGTCRTRVLEGVPDHRDVCLTPTQHASNTMITPCCSRALSEKLVLDI